MLRHPVLAKQAGDWVVSVTTMPGISVDNLDVSDRAARLLGHVTLDNASIPVTGSFFQATQPVSAAALPLPAGASTETTLAAIKAKTDNLDVALSTRAVTGLTDTQLRATAVPVSGTFWPATQPVSLASMPSTPVTGTFWPATQPVSIASMPSTPVTGTFWQATQPVSIAATVAVSGPLTDTQLRTTAVPVSGTFFQATQPVSIAGTVTTTALTDTQLRASAIKAREDAVVMTWVSAKTAAPAASAVQADTGALAAGNYDFDIFLVASDTVAVGKGLVIEHRNAANAATLQTLGGVVAGVSGTVNLRRYPIALNERIRVIAGTAAGAASSMYVSAIGSRVS